MVKKKISELTFDPLDLYKLGISKKELEKNIRLFQLQNTFSLYDPYSSSSIFDQDVTFGFRDRVSEHPDKNLRLKKDNRVYKNNEKIPYSGSSVIYQLNYKDEKTLLNKTEWMDGLRHGSEEDYYEVNSDSVELNPLSSLNNYKNGKRHGTSIDYAFENNQIFIDSITQFNNGLKNGYEYMFYGKKKNLKCKMFFKNGLLHNPSKSFYPSAIEFFYSNGNIAQRSFYNMGRRSREPIQYFKNGNIKKYYYLKNGKKLSTDNQ
tara:strand:- start:543 stop:1328 length:786 start_codon:yes stop_codon:yes gene_type:complete